MNKKAFLALVLFSSCLCQPLWAEKLYDHVILIINDVAITQNQMTARLVEEAAQKGINLNDPKAKKDAEEQIIKDLTDQALLESRARQLKLPVSEEMVDEELSNILQAKKLTQPGFEMMLEQSKTSLYNFKEQIRKKLLRERLLLTEVRAQVVMDNKSLKKQFAESTGWDQEAHARHILILVPQSATQETVEKARKKTLEIRAQLLKNPGQFNKLAQELSDDPSAKSNQGDLGYFNRGQMVPEFTEAAFSLPLKKVSEPIRTQFGFHLIEVLDRRTNKEIDFSVLEQQFQNVIYQQEYLKEYARYLDQLRAQAQIIDRR